MNIVIDDRIPLASEALGTLGEVVSLPGRSITRQSLAGADALVVRSITRVDRALLDGTSVRFVATATTGTDHVDIEYLRARGIEFATAEGANADAVAQYVVSALMHIEHVKGYSLRGRTIGIVGVGRIGSRVQTCAEALGMRCLLSDPPRQRREGGSEFVPLDHLLAGADIVTLHVPLTDGLDATRALAGHSFFSALSSGAVFINASRGEVVDEPALVSARARLAAVVLDVWDHEPDVDCRTIACTDIATPHIAGYSADAKIRATSMVYERLCGFLGTTLAWDPPASAEPRVVDVRGRSRAVYDAVHAAYPIVDDDLLMRELLTLDPTRRALHFESLRGGYRLRPEFRNFDVAADEPDRSILRGIGFGTAEL
jgi:erythronate-4-phosphate dehydrogenase